MSAVDAAFTLRGRLLPEGFPRVSSASRERARLCPAPCPVLPAHVPHAQPSLAANRTPAGSLLVVGPLHLPSPHERQALAGFRTSSGFPPPQPWRVASRPQSRFTVCVRPASSLDQRGRAWPHGLPSQGQGLPAPSPCSEAPFRGPRAALRVRCGLSSPSWFLTQLLIAGLSSSGEKPPGRELFSSHLVFPLGTEPSSGCSRRPPCPTTRAPL